MKSNCINIVLREKGWNTNYLEYAKFVSDYCRIPKTNVKIIKDMYSFKLNSTEMDIYLLERNNTSTPKEYLLNYI